MLVPIHANGNGFRRTYLVPCCRPERAMASLRGLADAGQTVTVRESGRREPLPGGGWCKTTVTTTVLASMALEDVIASRQG